MKEKKQKATAHDLSSYSKELRPRIDEIVSNLGFALLQVLFVQELDTNYLRLTISHPNKSISLDDCELVSKEIEKELDPKNLIPFSYNLEVQSPGADNIESEHQFVLEKSGLIIKS